MPTAVDLVTEQNEYRNHVWPFCLWPRQWKTFNRTLEWCSVELDHDHKSWVPGTPGVYSLVVSAEIAGHPCSSYLMYVGRATNLRRRFGKYLNEERTKRSKIVRLLELYRDRISFVYSIVHNNVLEDTEEELIDALVPPCNSKFTGELQRAIGAFL